MRDSDDESLPQSAAMTNANGIPAMRQREKEMRARLAAVVESSDDAIVSKTLDGIITTWNQGAQRMFGYTAEEAVGKSITMLMPPDHANEEADILGKLRKGEFIQHYETTRIRKDGTAVVVSISVSPIRDAEGKVVGASKIARDVTARKRMEEALREDARIFELLNRTGAVIASQLELQELLQSVTDAATQLSGARFGAFFYNTARQQGESFLLYALCGAPREMYEKLRAVARHADIRDDVSRSARGSLRRYHAGPGLCCDGAATGHDAGAPSGAQLPGRARRLALGRGVWRAVFRPSGSRRVHGARPAPDHGGRRPGGRGDRQCPPL